LQGSYRFADRWRATAGLRYTSDSKQLVSRGHTFTDCSVPAELLVAGVGGPCRSVPLKTDASKINYTLSVDYQARDDLMLYARTGTGFRSGSFNLRHVPDLATLQPIAPERVTDYELGVKSEWFNRAVRINLAAYYSKYDDIQRPIVIGSATGGAIQITTNAAKAHIKGAELEIKSIPFGRLELAATAAYTKAQYDEYADFLGDHKNDPFPETPEWTYSLSSAYTIPMASGDARVQLDWWWIDKRVPNADAIDVWRYMPSVGLLNARISKSWDSQGIEIAMFGRNVLDKRYIERTTNLSGSLGNTVGWVADPPLVGLEVRKSF
jgi:iron complex outermembrane receptor protein